MDLKLAKQTLQSNQGKMTLKQMEESTKESEKIFYFSNENNHKDLLKVVEHFQSLHRSAYLREVKYGLDEKEYIYELHII